MTNTDPACWSPRYWRTCRLPMYRMGQPLVFGVDGTRDGGDVTATVDIEVRCVPRLVSPPLTTRVYGPVTRLLETGCGT